MQTFFEDNKSSELIVLLNGWGMDERPYAPLKNERDILYVSDYSDLNFVSPVDFSNYEKLILITFSAGGYMAAYLKDKLPEFDLKIAVCGNFFLFSEDYGAPKDIVYQMETISFDNALEFRKNLVNDEREYNLFNENQPHRSLESSLQELDLLQKYSKENINLDFTFDKVIIGKQDKFLPYEHQLKAWKDFKNIKAIDGGHFLFYKFNSFDDVINY